LRRPTEAHVLPGKMNASFNPEESPENGGERYTRLGLRIDGFWVTVLSFIGVHEHEDAGMRRLRPPSKAPGKAGRGSGGRAVVSTDMIMQSSLMVHAIPTANFGQRRHQDI
jgi:hypothetical protein